MKNTLKAAICGILSALSVLLLFFGGASFVFAYIMPMVTGLIMIILKRTCGTSWAIAVFNIMITVVQLLLVYIFGISFLEEGTGKIFIPVFALLMNVMFIIYDMLINRLTLLYKFKLEKRIKKYFK